MGTARMKSDIDTEEVGKKRRVNLEKSRMGRKQDVPMAYLYLRPTIPSGLLLPQVVAELPNKPNIHL